MCHHNTFLVYQSMREASLERWEKVTHISLGFAWGVAALFGIAGYSTFRALSQGKDGIGFTLEINWLRSYIGNCRGSSGKLLLERWPDELQSCCVFLFHSVDLSIWVFCFSRGTTFVAMVLFGNLSKCPLSLYPFADSQDPAKSLAKPRTNRLWQGSGSEPTNGWRWPTLSLHNTCHHFHRVHCVPVDQLSGLCPGTECELKAKCVWHTIIVPFTHRVYLQPFLWRIFFQPWLSFNWSHIHCSVERSFRHWDW